MTAKQQHVLQTLGKFPGWRSTWQFGEESTFGAVLVSLLNRGLLIRRTAPTGTQWLRSATSPGS